MFLRPARLAVVFLAAMELAAVSSARAEDRQMEVFVMHSARRDTQLSILIDHEVPRALGAGLHQTVDYYAEYLDRSRFSDPVYREGTYNFLRLKYRGHHFSLVIAVLDDAIEFVDEYREQLFPGVPVVLYSESPEAKRLPNSAAIVNDVNLLDTIVLAQQLQPDLRNVFVVSGASLTDKQYEERARHQFRGADSKLAITYLSGLTTPNLESRLAALPPHSMVFFLLVYKDGLGENYNALEYVARVSSIANAPTYTWVNTAVERGVVGGNVVVQELRSKRIAALALRVLAGEKADAIPVDRQSLTSRQIDWRQLRRWGINEARVPAGTAVRFREKTLWERFWPYIVGTIVLIGAQAALIAGLTAQRVRRRRAEWRAHETQRALQASSARIRDLGGRLLRAQEVERSRLARELHDDIGQQLALLTIDLELISGAGGDLEEEGAELTHEALQRAQRVAKSVHDLSHRLHPATLQLVGLVAALDGLRREFSRPDLLIAFTHADVPPVLPHDLTVCLFRIAQEALQNVVKHSSAHRVTMDLVAYKEGLVLRIADDGIGFDPQSARRKGLGLISIGERLDAVDGTLAVWTEPGKGTQLQIVVPNSALSGAGQPEEVTAPASPITLPAEPASWT
jgi:signal transduction histidine kinase